MFSVWSVQRLYNATLVIFSLVQFNSKRGEFQRRSEYSDSFVTSECRRKAREQESKLGLGTQKKTTGQTVKN
jgi:hypothetical protein